MHLSVRTQPVASIEKQVSTMFTLPHSTPLCLYYEMNELYLFCKLFAVRIQFIRTKVPYEDYK